MKALLYTSDPYEPYGVIGLFETDEQKAAIIAGYEASIRADWKRLEAHGTFCDDIESVVQADIEDLKEIEIPIGVFGIYY